MNMFGYPIFFRWETEIHEKLDRVVIGIDPPFYPKDVCGIVVAGVGQVTGLGYVLADLSGCYENPAIWAQHICQAVIEYDADLVAVAGEEQSEMTASVLARSGVACRVRHYHFAGGRKTRFEPLADAYARQRIIHAAPHVSLMSELTTLEDTTARADRANALLAAMHELLMRRPAAYYRGVH
ncbi:DNA-packaging protein [Caulobacter phage Sansa]|uniref:DNA-packaging protein n=1 Tax=Caulobacter phage Sansa TaxID=1675600 RepID=A0A0K1LM17_9CAUD|nr:DNA-packaging protein [Caulobacter phage Sansa]AKU43499.1 DNA-packaging protein [Caulobacter phage Sansa]